MSRPWGEFSSPASWQRVNIDPCRRNCSTHFFVVGTLVGKKCLWTPPAILMHCVLLMYQMLVQTHKHLATTCTCMCNFQIYCLCCTDAANTFWFSLQKNLTANIYWQYLGLSIILMLKTKESTTVWLLCCTRQEEGQDINSSLAAPCEFNLKPLDDISPQVTRQQPPIFEPSLNF